MNILCLHVVSDLYGSSKVLLQAAHALKKQGHRVIVVVSENGPLVAALNELGIETSIIRLGVLRKRYLSFTGLINRAKVLWMAYHSLKKICAAENINLIYTNTAPVIIGGILAKRLNIKNIWHLHEMLEVNSFMHRFFGLIINQTSNKVVVVSDAVFNNWHSRIDPKKIVRIYNGIDPLLHQVAAIDLHTTLDLSPKTLLIGMIGRVNLVKGQFYFIEIAAAAKKLQLACHFIMVGDAYEGYEYLYEEVADKISNAGVNNMVTNLGYRTDTAQIINGLDLFMLPSIKFDSFPLVVLEAMAAAKPVIATNLGGATEQVAHGETGYLVPINDAEQVANYIKEFLENRVALKQMGLNAKSRVTENFLLTHFENNLVTLVASMQ